jgi:alkylation response protein AidB-like acyl-CoA dehydrogenase
MDFLPDDDHEMLRAAVRDLASDYGHDYYARVTREGKRPDELWQAVADHGFLGVHLPEEHGGGGAGISELAVVCEELAAQGCPLLLILVSAAISAEVITKFGSEAQRAEFLPGLATGTKMVFAITEADAGSNSHRIATTATRDGDVYRLRGSKTFISGVDEAPHVLVVCRTGYDEAHDRARLSLFVVDTDTSGLTSAIIPIEIQSPEKQYQLFFDDVQVPISRRIGAEGEGLRQVFEGLNPERIMSATICTGVGRYALGRASEYARDRAVWGTPIGAHQGIAHPLAEAKIELELARLMTEKAAWLHDHGTDRVAAGEAANMAKLASADAGMHCLDQAIQTHGGNGMASEYGLADLWGIVRLLRIAPVSREMVLNFVASQSLALPKSY